jgi:hypothetical protein
MIDLKRDKFIHSFKLKGLENGELDCLESSLQAGDNVSAGDKPFI